jgi:hypothetical protein
MKEKQRNIEEEIDLTLESFNGIKPVEANPYIFEKVMNRMQNQKRNNYYPKLKYALVISLLILINLFTFIYFSKGSNESATSSDDIKDTFKKEYSLTISTYNY